MGIPVTGGGQTPEGIERFLAVSELKVGDLDGPLALTDVGDIVVQGPRVFLSQPNEHRIRVISADSGELLAEWGGPGDGPGEFRALEWMGMFGDTLTVLDRGHRRITSFVDDGRVTDTRSFTVPPPEPPFVYGGWLRGTRDGNIAVIGATAPSIYEGASPDRLPWLLVSRDGMILDRPPSFRPEDRAAVLRRGDGITSVIRPIHRSDRFAMASDGSRLVHAGDPDGEGLRLAVYHTAEQRVDSIDLKIPPVEVPTQVGDSIMQELRQRLVSARTPRGSMLDGVDRRDLEAALAAPEWIPAVDEMFVTAGGEIWLRSPSFSGSHDRWRVVDEGGNVRALVDVPTGLRLHAREGPFLWGVRTEPSFDLVMVERLRIEGWIETGSRTDEGTLSPDPSL